MTDFHEDKSRMLAITIAFAIYTVVLYGITALAGLVKDNPVMQIVLTVILDVVSFTIIYKCVDYLYNKVLLKYIDKIDNLEGKWYVLHVPKSMNLSEYRFGAVTITQRYYRVFADARNYGTEILARYKNQWKPVNTFLKEQHDAIDEEIKKYNDSGRSPKDREKCLEEIDRIMEGTKGDETTGLRIRIKIDESARSTLWRYEIGRIDHDKSLIFAMFQAHSDKPIEDIKFMCNDCKEVISECEHCHDFKTEIADVKQEVMRYGGHMIKMDMTPVRKKYHLLSRSKKVIEMDGEYHNMLPNLKGEGKLYFIRQCDEIEESRNIPFKTLKRLKGEGNGRGAKDKKLKEVNTVLMTVLDDKTSMLDQDDYATSLSKLVSTKKMIEFVRDGIKFDMNSYRSRAILKMKSAYDTDYADLYDRNKALVGKTVKLSEYRPGYYRLAVNVYLVDNLKRVMCLRTGGSLSASFGGSVLSRESSSIAAERILEDVFGIVRKMKDVQPFMTTYEDLIIRDHYLFEIIPGDNTLEGLVFEAQDIETLKDKAEKGDIYILPEVLESLIGSLSV